MRFLCYAVSFCATASLAPAQSSGERIVTAEEFEALSTGKTLYFSRSSRFFGAEQFYTRRRSLWQNGAGQCLDGEWFAKDDLICFEYDQPTDPACWHFIEKSTGYVARAEGEGPENDIFLYHTDTKPLDCKGPAIGA